MSIRDIRNTSTTIMSRFADRVDEVEDRDMDEGRFFVHLKAPWTYDEGHGIQRTRSFGSVREALTVLKTVEKEA